MKSSLSTLSPSRLLALVSLFLLMTQASFAQTATPPSGTVVPNFDGLQIETDATGAPSSLTEAVNAQKWNAVSGESAVKGTVQAAGAGAAAGYLGYVDSAGDPYGVYTKADVLLDGNTYLAGSVFVESYIYGMNGGSVNIEAPEINVYGDLFVDSHIYGLGLEIRIQTDDLHLDIGDFHVQDGDLKIHMGDINVVEGDIRAENGTVSAQAIGNFYTNEYSLKIVPADQSDPKITAAVYCDGYDIVVACSGHAVPWDMGSGENIVDYQGANPTTGSGYTFCESYAWLNKLDTSKLVDLQVYAYCFDPSPL